MAILQGRIDLIYELKCVLRCGIVMYANTKADVLIKQFSTAKDLNFSFSHHNDDNDVVVTIDNTIIFALSKKKLKSVICQSFMHV